MRALLYRISPLDIRTSMQMPMGQSCLNQNGSRWEKMIYLTVGPFETSRKEVTEVYFI